MVNLSLFSFVTAGLCFVAYLLGVRRRQIEEANLSIQSVRKAHELARALEQVVQELRGSVRKHQKNIDDFHHRLETKSALELKDAERVVDSSYDLISRLVISQGHISEQLGRLKELTQSRTDYLTGASNRCSFDESLNAVLTRYKETGQVFCLALVDIDHFKAVNDRFGHTIGDKTLKHVTDLMSSYIRQTDSLARIGGEEFGIILGNSDLTGAVRVVERIREGIEASTMQVDDREVRVTISAGVVTPSPGESLESLNQRADDLLYRAKDNGRNQVCADQPRAEIVHTNAEQHSACDDLDATEPKSLIAAEAATHRSSNACCSIGAT